MERPTSRQGDQVGEIGFKEPSRSSRTTDFLAFLLFWLSKYVFCVQSGGVVKELAKLAIILANGQKVNMAPLVLASLYRGLKTLTYQTSDGSPISGHGPLWILKLWIHAYFVFYPKFGANELKERLTSGSEENFACYVDVLRLSPRTTCSFQECFEAFYTKETIETFTPFTLVSAALALVPLYSGLTPPILPLVTPLNIHCTLLCGPTI